MREFVIQNADNYIGYDGRSDVFFPRFDLLYTDFPQGANGN